jgi:uncharacterized protein YndB with AHSA1/START domain
LAGALRVEGGLIGVRFERAYATGAADVWDAITNPERVGRWLAPVSGDLRIGGAYRVDFGDGNEAVGEITACDAPRRLEISWDFPGETPSTVLVTIESSGAGCLLVLDHTQLPQNQGVGYAAGWHAYLDRLGPELTGDPLPDWDTRFDQELANYRSPIGGS